MRLTYDDMERAKPGMVKMPCSGGWYKGLTQESDKGVLKRYSDFLFGRYYSTSASPNSLRADEYCLGCRLIAIKLFLERYK